MSFLGVSPLVFTALFKVVQIGGTTVGYFALALERGFYYHCTLNWCIIQSCALLIFGSNGCPVTSGGRPRHAIDNCTGSCCSQRRPYHSWARKNHEHRRIKNFPNKMKPVGVSCTICRNVARESSSCNNPSDRLRNPKRTRLLQQQPQQQSTWIDNKSSRK